MQKYRPFLIIALVLAIAIIGGSLLLRLSRKQSFAGPGLPSPQAISKTQTIPAEAVVTLEEFGDYQCPPCGELHPILKQLKTEMGQNLNFLFRNLPLTTIHKNSLAAAQAAEAARMQNRFWEMHDLLYENQELWGDDVNPRTIFLKWSADLVLDASSFAQDMDGKQVKLRIEADQEAAAELGIHGTPTVLVNGRQLRPEVTKAEGIRAAIQYVTSRKSSPQS
jgi:protein-disulfide isomerase